MRRVREIDWSRWEPSDRATLVFVRTAGRVLLIRKKRGLGAGKVNGPGGRLEPGETPDQCALREVREELRITPTAVERMGELRFQFVDGYGIHVYVYRAGGFVGTPTETAEAAPLWFDEPQIPYDEMWEDDRIWLPMLLDGRPFDGRFVFDDDAMLDHELESGSGWAGSGSSEDAGAES